MVLPNIINREQCGFLADHHSIDIIIVVKEMVHSLEQETSTALRMILKVDIDKAYNTLNWNVILATYAKMGFPMVLINWIKGCLHSNSFSFIINGQSSKIIRANRGV